MFVSMTQIFSQWQLDFWSAFLQDSILVCYYSVSASNHIQIKNYKPFISLCFTYSLEQTSSTLSSLFLRIINSFLHPTLLIAQFHLIVFCCLFLFHHFTCLLLF